MTDEAQPYRAMLEDVDLARAAVATRETGMFDALANGLVATFNGLWAFAGQLFTLRVGLIGVLVLGLAWMAAIEVEDLDRRGTRPTIRRH